MVRSRSILARDGPTVINDTGTNTSHPGHSQFSHQMPFLPILPSSHQASVLWTWPPGSYGWPTTPDHTEADPKYLLWQSRRFPGLGLWSSSIPDLSGPPDSFGQTLMSRLSSFDETNMSRPADSLGMVTRIIRNTHEEFDLPFSIDESVMRRLAASRHTSSRPRGP